jgi:hypothetical protein
VDELLFKNSPVKMTFLALCAAGFVAMPFALSGRVPFYKEVILWIGGIFFSACVVAILSRSLAAGSPMRLTGDGFEAKCYGIPFVPWTDVEAAWTVRIKSSDLLCIKLRNPDQLLDKLSAFRRRTTRVNQKLGYGDVCLATSGMTPGFAELLAYAKKHIPNVSAR